MLAIEVYRRTTQNFHEVGDFSNRFFRRMTEEAQPPRHHSWPECWANGQRAFGIEQPAGNIPPRTRKALRYDGPGRDDACISERRPLAGLVWIYQLNFVAAFLQRQRAADADDAGADYRDRVLPVHRRFLSINDVKSGVRGRLGAFGLALEGCRIAVSSDQPNSVDRAGEGTSERQWAYSERKLAERRVGR